MDDADLADSRIEELVSDGVEAVRRRAKAFDVGNPGECAKCGEDRPRLVNDWCCGCRDKYGLP